MVSVCVKLATILEAIENTKDFVPAAGSTENTVTIGLDVFNRAWRLTKFLVNKNLDVYDNLAHDTLMKQCKTVIDNIHHDKKKTGTDKHQDWESKGFKNNSLFRNSQSATLRDSMSSILEVLVEYGYLFRDGDRYYPVD